MEIEPINVARLEVPARLPDLRRDLHVFADYVRGHEVKRSHRGNALGKADAKRLAKLMSDTEAAKEVDETGSSAWVTFVDDVALELGFVQYDTEGKYAGYSSQEPSFPDNYIEFQEKPYARFLAAKAAQQETTLLELLLKDHQGGASEFYRTSVLGRLDGFSTWGSAIGVMPTLDFAAVRRFLLGLLAECHTGQWLSVASLVAHLKKDHRYFLIPKKPQFKNNWEAKEGRYDNFHESTKDRWGNEIHIREGDEDAFERVEGRYLERFLEGIPLLLGYVDVAYATKCPKAVYPSLGYLKGFRVSQRLRPALEKRILEPRVIVTPSFDVHVQAETYPAGVLSKLVPLCELVAEDTSLVLKLNKQKVAGARAADPKLDAANLLQTLSGGEVPANVARELSSWSEHGEKFMLFADCSLLEADPDLPVADPFTIERLAPGIRIVRTPEKLFGELERRELMPLRIKHGGQAFSPLPKDARTCFPKAAAGREKPRLPKTQVKLNRVTRVQLVCSDREFMDKLHRLLMEGKCPAEMDRKNLVLTYSKQHESEVSSAVRRLKTEYRIEIEDVP
jgi:hypothetical protein